MIGTCTIILSYCSIALCLLSVNKFGMCIAFTTSSLGCSIHRRSGVRACGTGIIQSSNKIATYEDHGTRIFLSNPSGDDDYEESKFNCTELSYRISQIEKSEREQVSKFTSGLQQRVQELESSKNIQQEFESSGIISVPVISFDAMLPSQTMEGSTSDPTFIRMLMEVGLGGWFGMVSLNFRTRKLRRNGALCKIEFLDAAKKKEGEDRLPTSVDFVIKAKRRCRVIGKSEALKLRIGRWRRSYDENGEESVLGWGEERFLDLKNPSMNDQGQVEAQMEDALPRDSTKWSLTNVECNLDEQEKNLDIDREHHQKMIEKAETLLPLIDEWYDLASNAQTYHNVNVTASTRVQRGQPYLSVEPGNLLNRVMKDLGDRPSVDDPIALAFWAAALINPLPPLGVSLEIRGRILEATCVEERLNVLEMGLKRSIQNLNGERPL